MKKLMHRKKFRAKAVHYAKKAVEAAADGASAEGVRAASSSPEAVLAQLSKAKAEFEGATEAWEGAKADKQSLKAQAEDAKAQLKGLSGDAQTKAEKNLDGIQKALKRAQDREGKAATLVGQKKDSLAAVQRAAIKDEV
jgi:hypothetical protein